MMWVMNTVRDVFPVVLPSSLVLCLAVFDKKVWIRILRRKRRLMANNSGDRSTRHNCSVKKGPLLAQLKQWLVQRNGVQSRMSSAVGVQQHFNIRIYFETWKFSIKLNEVNTNAALYNPALLFHSAQCFMGRTTLLGHQVAFDAVTAPHVLPDQANLPFLHEGSI